MKLLYKNILTNTVASLIIIFLGGLTTYYFTLSKIEQESREHLLSEKKIVEEKLKEGVAVSSLINNIGDKIIFKEISSLTGREFFFKTIEQKEEYEASGEKEEEEAEEKSIFSAQSIVFETATADKDYRVTIIKSFDNDEELGKNILFAVTLSAILMIITIAIVNIFIYKKLWKPFYAILDELRKFTVSKNDTLKLPETDTKEFNYLAGSLTTMAEKITYDFLALKEFTENASHEIQTPLSVISSKIEMCLQDTQLTSQQARLLTEASHAVNTLANLNKGLITLTKLDNNQVEYPVDVNIDKLISDRLLLFEEFIQEKNISVEVKTDKTVNLKINPLLANILFDNLIKNAVKHNFKGGEMLIEVTKDFIKIANTGAEPTVNTDKFFERFYKTNSEDSLGLGLAITKKICDTNALKISYDYKEGYHLLTITLRLNY
ncbi:MAG TPA: HAMP domain-containing sensor histidine kinase [Bacteroidia bacterium]|jgi:two-component system sensor histidine kinase QseC|nr:HAMP domain-containing sensor histidine kinase [Bacteroidia bacterium]